MEWISKGGMKCEAGKEKEKSKIIKKSIILKGWLNLEANEGKGLEKKNKI